MDLFQIAPKHCMWVSGSQTVATKIIFLHIYVVYIVYCGIMFRWYEKFDSAQD